MPKSSSVTGKVIGIYAYVERPGDNLGGVQTHVRRITDALVARGAHVVLHCLASQDSGWRFNPDSNLFECSPSHQHVTESLTVFIGTNGPGDDGAIQENVRSAKSEGEELVLAFGTRAGYIFEIAAHVADQLSVPMVSFVYFVAEEREYEAQFVNRSRSYPRAIPGVATGDEIIESLAHDREVVQQAVKRSNLVVVPTKYAQRQLVSLVPSARDIAVIYHGVPIWPVDGDEQKWHGRIGSIHASRSAVPFACNKNFFWSIEFAATQFSRIDNRGLPLKIIGEGNARELIEKYVRYNGTDNEIVVGGALSERELAREYRQARYLMAPSMMEAGITVVPEAVLGGALPIALQAGGTTEVMTEIGLDSFLIPGSRRLRGAIWSVEPDIDLACSVIDYARSNVQTVENAIEHAQNYVRKHFTVEKTTELLIQELVSRSIL